MCPRDGTEHRDARPKAPDPSLTRSYQSLTRSYQRYSIKSIHLRIGMNDAL